MNEISISEFKAKCLGLIDEVQKTRQPLRITRRGKPVAEVIPAGPDHTRKFVGDLAKSTLSYITSITTST